MDEHVETAMDENRVGVHNTVLGRKGEEAAARYLMIKDYEIVEMNWTCAAGEADIIAWGEECLVFCEVKTRTNIDKGFPSEAVTKKKRQKYEKIAAWYLQDHDWLDVRIRFDVIDILVVGPDRAMIKHIVNAFGVA